MELRQEYIPEISLVQMTPEKEEEYAPIIQFLYQELEDYKEKTGKEEDLKYLLCRVNDDERLVQFIDNMLVVYYRKGAKDQVYSRYLELDSEYHVVHASYETHELFNKDGNLFFRNYQTGLLEDFDYTKNGFVDNFGYDGSAVYSQYDEANDRQLYLVYPIVDRPDGMMYQFHLNKPLKYMFIDHASKVKKDKLAFHRMKGYARYEFDTYESYPYFTLATIREYGLVRTLMNGPVALQKTDSITRYCCMLGMDSNNTIHVSFAFGEQLTEEEMDEKLKTGGFLTTVPDYVIDTYNLANRDYIEDCCLAQVIEDVNKRYMKENGYSLVYPGGKHGDS